MAYPAAMDTHPTFPPDLWEQTPPEVRAYIGTLEARVVALEAMVQALQEQLKQDSRNSSRPPSSDSPAGIVKLLGMIVSPGNSRHFPDAIATDPTLRRPALYQ